jgi:predicted TIM-barrel fold metal-dependent hydrolase
MTKTGVRESAAEIRARLDHPVIDADGHIIEYRPALDAYMKEEGVPANWRELLVAAEVPADQYKARHRAWQSPLSITSNTLDLATATMPQLLYKRLEELGLDFVVMYPTQAQWFPGCPVDGLRAALCRAENRYVADMTSGLRDRISPVAVLPMGNPQEALEELEYVVHTLGTKAIMIGGFVQRPTPGVPDELLWETGWLDTFGIDSAYDYDPLWAKCQEYGLVVAEHTIGMGWGSRRSPSNYVYNQIGHFAASGEAVAKSLFLGGVTRRFPELRFAFLEGGVGWATSLYSDLVNRWEKRNGKVVGRYQMSNIDRPMFNELLAEFGEELQRHGKAETFRSGPDVVEDDFAPIKIDKVEDFQDLFVDRFYFGCEADDPSTKLAFDRSINPLNAKLHPLFSSDIGHWDVPDMSLVMHEAYEQVDHGWLNEDEFREFTCTNVVEMYTAGNPNFFEGTAVADAVKPYIAKK